MKLDSKFSTPPGTVLYHATSGWQTSHLGRRDFLLIWHMT